MTIAIAYKAKDGVWFGYDNYLSREDNGVTDYKFSAGACKHIDFGNFILLTAGDSIVNSILQKILAEKVLENKIEKCTNAKGMLLGYPTVDFALSLRKYFRGKGDDGKSFPNFEMLMISKKSIFIIDETCGCDKLDKFGAIGYGIAALVAFSLLKRIKTQEEIKAMEAPVLIRKLLESCNENCTCVGNEYTIRKVGNHEQSDDGE